MIQPFIQGITVSGELISDVAPRQISRLLEPEQGAANGQSKDCSA